MKYYSIWFVGICVLVFLLQLIIPGFTEFFLLDGNAIPQFWRFISSIFLHGGIGHLFYNMFALGIFGLILERLIGSKKFLMVFIISGIVANIISYPFYDSSLGASGAIFGVIGALILVRPMITVWAFGMPMPIFIAGILWAGGDLIGAVAFVTGNPIDNTGNIAHLSGLVIGLIFGAFYRDWSKKRESKSSIYFDENHVRRWEDYNLR